MKLLKWIYEKKYKKTAPYYYDYSFCKIVGKPIRKWFTNVVAADCPFNVIRIFIYRLCGFKIGKHSFIGMKCYLDDMCYDSLIIGDNVIVSYGTYFACHGVDQDTYPIVIKDGAYVGMRAMIISKNATEGNTGVTIGSHAIVGAGSLVNRNVPDDATAVGVPCRIKTGNKQ